jgi:hypothetical protein
MAASTTSVTGILLDNAGHVRLQLPRGVSHENEKLGLPMFGTLPLARADRGGPRGFHWPDSRPSGCAAPVSHPQSAVPPHPHPS